MTKGHQKTEVKGDHKAKFKNGDVDIDAIFFDPSADSIKQQEATDWRVKYTLIWPISEARELQSKNKHKKANPTFKERTTNKMRNSFNIS